MTKQTKVLVVSDFDGTITKKDTTHLSFKSTKKFRHASANQRQQLLDDIKKLGENYMKNYQLHFNESVLENENRSKATTTSTKTTDLTTNRKNLFHFLKRIDDFNIQSRVSLACNSHFDDVTLEGIEDLAKEILFNAHALDTLQNFHQHDNITCKILSVNWFPDLLKTSLQGVVANDDVIASTFPRLRKFEVDFKQFSTSDVDFGQVSTALGKVDWMRDWNKKFEGCVSVYLGDSVTDFGALLEATYGIIYGGDEKVIKVANIFGIDIIPLFSVLKNDKNNNKSSYSNGDRDDTVRMNGLHGIESSDNYGITTSIQGNDIGDRSSSDIHGNDVSYHDNNHGENKRLYCTTCWNEIEAFILQIVCRDGA